MSMIRYTRVDGLQTGVASGLPAIQVSTDGQRIGSIPGWNTLLTPSHVKNDEPRNRVVSNQYLPRAFSNPLTIGDFPNGAPSFDMNITNRYDGTTDINKTAWTAFCVIRMRAMESAANEFLRGKSGFDTSGLRSPRMGIAPSTESFVVWEEWNSTTVVASISTESFINRTALLMVTYSEGSGLRIYENGALGATAENYAGFEANDTAGTYQWLSSFTSSRTADVGHTGLFDIDLSRPENAGHRRALENYLIELYGIDA